MAWAKDSASSPGLALLVGSLVVPPTSVDSRAPPSPTYPTVSVYRPGADADGVFDSGTTFSALVYSSCCRSVMAALGHGGVAPPDSSFGLCIDAELYKSITSYTSDYIDQLCYTHTNSRRLTGL
jgi:hypothetical protein